MARDAVQVTLQGDADRVDELLTGHNPPPSVVAVLRSWMEAHPEYVHGPGTHTTLYSPDRWRSIEPWPGEMPRSTTDATSIPQTREDVTRIAARCRESGGWLELLVAAVVWGHKKADYGPARLAKMLKCPCHHELHQNERQARLAAAVELLDMNGPAVAYQSLSRQGPNHVPHLGPAFFSKILYFADRARSAPVAIGRPAAIILDRTTAQRMINVSREYANDAGILHPDAERAIYWVWNRTAWSSHRYDVYCQWSDRCARFMAERYGWPPMADLIELAIFTAPAS